MDIQIVNPLKVPDWDRLVLSSSGCSFFHSSAWAKTLVDAYDFGPAYFIALEKGRLIFLMPLMKTRGLLGRPRGVSLPFTDQCPSLIHNDELFVDAVQTVIHYAEEARWEFIEWRDAGHFTGELPVSEIFYTHDIDLLRSEAELFSSLSDNNRRNIHKALREGLIVRVDRSLIALEQFHKLNMATRKRHGLPSQPFSFFRSVFENILSKDLGVVVTVSHQTKTIAASVYFHFGKKAIYKYGASERAYHHLRPNNLMIWKALEWHKHQGYEAMNLGRSELNNPGLLRFKRSWGGAERLIKYHLYDCRIRNYVAASSRNSPRFAGLLSRLPGRVLQLLGRLFYGRFG